MSVLVVAVSLATASCIQSEAPESEADIESCVVDGDILLADPIIENDKITLVVDPTVDLTNITLYFTLTKGASVVPASGTPLNFTTPQTYTVTSEDGQWSKTYTVSCIATGIGSTYEFEHYRLNNGVYYEFFEVGGNGEEQDIWASGNPGFKIVASGLTPEDYPTVPSADGLLGSCIKLETRSTGRAGAVLKMPLAAGNLFLGSYAGGLNALKATHFGLPVDFIPSGLKGYYKYKAGEVYTNKQNAVETDKKDNFDIYGILYETDDRVKYLDGTNSLTSPNLVAIARITDDVKQETDRWTYFYLPFNVLEGKTIDPEKLADNKYNVSIVFSSSIDGATFSGAVGSTLYIDQVELIHLEREDE